MQTIKMLGYDIEARLEARDAADQGSGAHPDLKALRRLLVGTRPLRVEAHAGILPAHRRLAHQER
jgi:hypothetical protein